MTKNKKSLIIVPLIVIADLIIINVLAYFLPINFTNPLLFHAYISIMWGMIAFRNKFYEVYRVAKVPELLNMIFHQFSFFFLVLYAFIGLFKEPLISRLLLAQFFFFSFLSVFTLKFILYYLLMTYRERLRGNIRNVVVIGKNKKTDQLVNVFKKHPEYGYNFIRQYSTADIIFDIHDCFSYIYNNDIDEIYCSISELSNGQITEFINFSDNNLKTLKFIPDNKIIFSKKLKFEYYDYVPVLSLRDIPLDNGVNYILKRIFDVCFSLVVIVCLLSWLVPLIGIIIKLESKGPVFFRQMRPGVDGEEFACYKFRSMQTNADSNKPAERGDMRITNIGKFIRKTSIDELPQFYNVLFGDMSIVGPRPHPIQLTEILANKVDKFMVRHLVKPGITGLAQVKGYRGEIENDVDILNRVKFDIFYLENWSLLMDFKIIFQTVVNVVVGEEKAY